ncbi:hypothetical protein BB776_03475 [Planococcus salinarum]|uniref:DUF2281 domain-containing protein n=1 Tax=Planococcus salinarum TaxID=622695 RepID=A0ABX3D0V0_9BACL|nr:DUF1700 domain-containing protein [Planococcus salinarum]OHX51210.1 hypothetical protein BB776_03475 [Planococcus salinarum]
MTEQQFLQQLEQALDRLPAEERNDILQDIREYFANGRADGKIRQRHCCGTGRTGCHRQRTD